MKKQLTSIDEYISSQDKKLQSRLLSLRKTIRSAAPAAEECISYSMPAFKQQGILVCFAAHTSHIGFYPMPSAIAYFKKDIAGYVSAKGSVQFPNDKPLPLPLIKKMVAFRVKENEEKAAAKKPKATAVKKTASPQKSETDAVNAWLAKQEAGYKTAVNAIRKIIRAASPVLKERIKWNAPSYYTTADLLTFGPSRNNKLLLVFHHPAVVKIKSPLLQGEFKNRRLVYFNSKADAEKNKIELTRIIRELIALVK